MIDRTRLGERGPEVPRLCLGTMTFARQNDERDAHSQLDYALERGVDFIDTAEVYPMPLQADTYGGTERIVGAWLQSKPRDKVILATKVAGPGRGMGWIRTGQREGLAPLSKRDIVLACEGSLKRLGTDYIDLYQLHWPARNVPLFGNGGFDPAQEREHAAAQESLEALDLLVRDGKIRHAGVSNETPWGICEFTRTARRFGLPRVVSVQNVYNLMSREFEQAMAETVMREKVGMLSYSALAFGLLSGKYRGGAMPPAARLTLFGAKWPRYSKPGIPAAVDAYADIAAQHGLTPVQLALGFAYHRWFVSSTIIGGTSVAQLAECIDAYSVKLSPEILAQIDAVHARMPNPAP